MKRKVAKLVAPRRFEITEEELPSLKPDELLMRVISCGLCHSEVPTYLGEQQLVGVVRKEGGGFRISESVQFPVVMGHEPVAVIEDVGAEVKGFGVGDFVSGWKRQCFADYVVTDASKLVKLPINVEEPGKCLAEPLGCVVNIVRAASPPLGDSVAVIGCGFMGLLCIAGLRMSGAFECIAIDLIDERLEWAKKLGATKTLNPRRDAIVEWINDVTSGRGVDVVIEITGSMKGFRLAMEIVRQRGKVLIPSLYGRPEPMEAGFQLMLKAPTIHSTHPWYSEDSMRDLTLGIEAAARRLFPIEQLVTHEFRLEDIDRAFNMLVHPDPSYLKGIIIP